MVKVRQSVRFVTRKRTLDQRNGSIDDRWRRYGKNRRRRDPECPVNAASGTEFRNGPAELVGAEVIVFGKRGEHFTSNRVKFAGVHLGRVR